MKEMDWEAIRDLLANWLKTGIRPVGNPVKGRKTRKELTSTLMAWTMLKKCEKAKADIERMQLKAKVEKEILEKDTEIQMKLFSAVREMNERVKRIKEQDKTPHAQEEKMPDAVQNALRYTTTYGVCRFLKISCGLMLDNLVAYVLSTEAQPSQRLEASATGHKMQFVSSFNVTLLGIYR
ncbi:hypothetical protein ACROYT_G014251 [Oculina patagonica]